MSTETKTADELRGRPVEKATANEAFRARSLSDPKGAIEEESGLAVPASLSLEVHKESAATTHPILPPDSKLSESDLQAVRAECRYGHRRPVILPGRANQG